MVSETRELSMADIPCDLCESAELCIIASYFYAVYVGLLTNWHIVILIVIFASDPYSLVSGINKYFND